MKTAHGWFAARKSRVKKVLSPLASKAIWAKRAICYSQVSSIEGGFDAWSADQMPVSVSQQPSFV